MPDSSLTTETRRLNQSITRLVKQQSLPSSFLRGVASGFGSVIGATIVVAVLAYLLSNVELIPLIGSWLAELVEYVAIITN
jgi:uncharacterized protein (DUF2062 family)